MSEFKASGFSDEFGSSGPDIVGLTTFTSPYYFVPPSGSTAERPSSPPPGMLRFNTDIGRLEVWRNDHWATILGESPRLGDHNAGAGESRAGTGTRGVFGGNRNLSGVSVPSSPKSEYITLSTLGNAVDFGNLTQQVALQGSFSSRTRGVFFGGYCHPVAGARTSRIAGFTFASTGSHEDFSSVTSIASQSSRGVSNETRGICFLGNTFPAGVSNKIEHVTIASVGNSVDFGDLLNTVADGLAFGSSVRGVYAGGYTQAPVINTIQYITLSTTGNAQEFGDLSTTIYSASSGGNTTRGIRMGGQVGPTGVNTTEYVTIASTGNAQDFGDLVNPMRSGCQANVSSPIRSITAGGYQSSNEDMIQYITNSTTGNAIDFGNLTEIKFQFSGASNGHGGL